MRRSDGLIQQMNVKSGLVVVPGSDPMSLSGLQVLTIYSIQEVMIFMCACGVAVEELLGGGGGGGLQQDHSGFYKNKKNTCILNHFLIGYVSVLRISEVET